MEEKIKVYGLIGRDIDYSFSKDYFNKKFKREKIINSCYKNFDLKEINQFKNLIEKKDIIGLNVTIPYKKSRNSWWLFRICLHPGGEKPPNNHYAARRTRINIHLEGISKKTFRNYTLPYLTIFTAWLWLLRFHKTKVW